MLKRYHWMSNYTGEVCTTLEMLQSIIWAIRERRDYPALNLWKYAISWRFSRSGY